MPKQGPGPITPSASGDPVRQHSGGASSSGDSGRVPAAIEALFLKHGSRGAMPAERALDLGAEEIQYLCVHKGDLLASIDLPDDRRQVLFFYHPGDVVFADVLRTSRSVRLRALGPVEFSALTCTQLDEAKTGDPATVSLLLAAAVRHLSALMLHTAAIGRLRSEERLATFVLELALSTGSSGKDAVAFDFEMRRDDVADYLGLNPDTLSRAMSKLRREHVLTFLTASRVVARIEALSERTPLAGAVMTRLGQTAARA